MATRANDEYVLDLGVEIDDAILDEISGGAGGDGMPSCPNKNCTSGTVTVLANSQGKLFYCTCGCVFWANGRILKQG